VATGLVVGGVILAGVSGLAGLLAGRRSLAGSWLSTALAVLGSGLGLAGVGWFWAEGSSEAIAWEWPLLPGVLLSVGVDGLSAFFLAPVFLISLAGQLYGLGYWKPTDHPETSRKLRLFYGAMTAGMGLLVIARNSVVFLFGWEVMALSGFFLVVTEDHEESREAGWLYLVATHTATLSLFGLFALLHAVSGTYAWVVLEPQQVSPGMGTAIFGLAVVGFGLKAGIMPLHVWLPSAHAAAPSHVSAILSGVLIKMGIYGLVRVTSLLPEPPVAWGGVVLALGILSGVLGVAFAIGQHDLKRLLAYHSIENIGIILLGVGLALLGRSWGRAELVVLGLAGGLLHVWNHALFKALLFLSAGSVVHAVHTREIDQLGGLGKRMPWTALGFLVGAVAICGLPPLNGFVSEFLLYLGLFRVMASPDGVRALAAVAAVPALALIGTLAVACFVKVYGVVFLGVPRTAAAEQAHESPPSMLGPLGLLAGCCFLIGLGPRLIVPALAQAVTAWEPALEQNARLEALAPLDWITGMGLLLVFGLVVAGVWLKWRLRAGGVERGATWGCGYLAPTPRMQYTSSSFAQMLVGLFAWALRPRCQPPQVTGLFPQKAAFHSEVPDPVLEAGVLPVFRFGKRLFSGFRVFQGGSIQAYLLYIFAAVIVLLLWR